MYNLRRSLEKQEQKNVRDSCIVRDCLLASSSRFMYDTNIGMTNEGVSTACLKQNTLST